MKTYDARTRERWTQWLAQNHASESEIWLIFYKKHTGKPSIDYKDALDAALCYGWIDSLIKRIDADRYARKFTPRKPDSNWSSINVKRYKELKAAGNLAPPGLARGPEGRPIVDGPPPDVFPTGFPAYIRKALKQDGRAWTSFEALLPSQRRRYINWIDTAKREGTKQSRLRQAIALLRTGKKLGLK